MANLRETSVWEAGIYQFETSDPVMGGENGIDNRPTRQLANRTLWLKNQIAAAVESIGALGNNKADKTITLTAGNGLSGGGSLAANRTISLGTPGTITAGSTNLVTATSHTHAIDSASTTKAGVVMLVNDLASDDTDKALTAAQGKVLGAGKADKTINITAGNGLTGGGTLSAGRTITLGTPGKITATSTNDVSATSHTHEIDNASLTTAGVVRLSNAIDSAAVNMAATPKAVMDALAAANAGNLAMHGALGAKNLNDLKGEAHYGVHFQSLNNGAADGLNYPVQLAGTLLVLPAAYQGRQLYLPFNQPVMYVRTTDGGSNWNGWAAIGEVANRLDGTSATAALSAAQGKVLNETKLGNSGPQTISNGSLTISGGGGNLVLGRGSTDVYIRNTGTNKYLQLKDDGTLAYSNDKVMLYSDRSDAVNLNDTAKIATSRAVKTAYDKAASVEATVITAGSGLTGGGNLTANRTVALGTPGTITASSGNSVTATSHTHAIDNTLLTPSGTVAYFAGNTAPAGWLKANGAAVSRTTYANLFAAIGTTYGAGNGSTTFNLPDLRGEFVRGWDDGRGIDGGRELGSWQKGTLVGADDVAANWGNFAPALNKGTSPLTHNQILGVDNITTSHYPNIAGLYGSTHGAGSYALNNWGSAGALGSTRPRNVALLACIKI